MKIQAFFPCGSYEGGKAVERQSLDGWRYWAKLGEIAPSIFLASNPKPEISVVIFALFRREPSDVDGEKTATVILRNRTSDKEIASMVMRFQVVQGNAGVIATDLFRCKLDRPGEYVFELWLDGTQEKSYWPMEILFTPGPR